jgi:hypothetical protein
VYQIHWRNHVRQFQRIGGSDGRVEFGSDMTLTETVGNVTYNASFNPPARAVVNATTCGSVDANGYALPACTMGPNGATGYNNYEQ